MSGGERVMRGKDWCRDYGNQDNGGFGTVVQVGERCGLCGAYVWPVPLVSDELLLLWRP